jgi:hypothetical protein
VNQPISTCPSCGAGADDTYCSQCGEKLRSKMDLSLWAFLKDAFEEVFNVDSKFLRTVRLLVARPGFLTNEALAGRTVRYIKPFRLYIIIVVLHFLVFSLSGSGDIFTVEKIPVTRLFPQVLDQIHLYEGQSGLSHVAFTDAVNSRIKDNLNVLFYFVVFILAALFKVFWAGSGKYYIEHLYYLLHLISFGLLRNIFLIPLIYYDFLVAALVISAGTQLVYTYISIRVVYKTAPLKTALNVLLTIAGFIVVLAPTLLLSLVIAVIQILN